MFRHLILKTLFGASGLYTNSALAMPQISPFFRGLLKDPAERGGRCKVRKLNKTCRYCTVVKIYWSVGFCQDVVLFI